MIVQRSRTVTLYHVTRVKNLDSIRREGLQLKYFRPRKENELLGITGKAIYFVKDRRKLVKPIVPGKDAIVEVRIPQAVYDAMPKMEGDLEWEVSKSHRDYARVRAEIMKKAYPEHFTGMTVEDIVRESTPLEYMSPENTVCILADIPKEYITGIYYN